MDKRLFRSSRLLACLVLLTLSTSLIILGCSKEYTGDEDFIATVNKEPIKLKDFQRELAIRSKQNPAYKITPQAIDEQLNTIIDRRLMIQEAMKSGLANSDDFVRTIQTFWEQTLIRELIEAKNHEWEDRLFVTEQEINEYYEHISKEVADLPPLEKIHDQIKHDILEEKKTNVLDEWLTGVRLKADIDINQEVIKGYLEVEDENLSGGGGDVR